MNSRTTGPNQFAPSTSSKLGATSSKLGATSSKLGVKQSINVQIMSLTSPIYDHFIFLPSSVTLTFDLRKQMFWTALLLLKDNNCAKLF